MEQGTLLTQIEETQDPKMKWTLLESAGPGDEALESARLWWHARYAFTDKKKRQVCDKFVWLLMYAASVSQGTFRDMREFDKVYGSALESPELEKAMAAGDRLFENLLSAARIYVDTLRAGRSILGLISTGGQSQDAVNRRVSDGLVRNCFAPIMSRYGDRAHSGLLLRALAQAAGELFAGIQPYLNQALAAYPDDALRSAINSALLGNAYGDTPQGADLP